MEDEPNIGAIKGRLHRFVVWFTENGGAIHPAVELCYSTEQGVAMRLKPDMHFPNGSLPPGTQVISCPHVTTLSALNAVDTPPTFPRHGKSDSENVDIALSKTVIDSAPRPQCLAAVWLCVQRLFGTAIRGKESWWIPYLDCLPGPPSSQDPDEVLQDSVMGELDLPLWWNAQELQRLSSNVNRGRMDLEDRWESEWKIWGDKVNNWARDHKFGISW